MSIYIGIDVGRFFHVAYCLDERGNQITTLTVSLDVFFVTPVWLAILPF